MNARRLARAPLDLALASSLRARTRDWPAHSRLFVLGDELGWALDDEAAYMTAVAREAGYALGPPSCLEATR